MASEERSLSLDEPLNPTLAALSTLSLLNLRLSRLEFLLIGHSATSQESEGQQVAAIASKDHPKIPAQLRTLEMRLNNLKRLDGPPGNLVRMVDGLRREYPELFPNQTRSSDSPPLSVNELSLRAGEVLSNSTLYTTTSAHLQTLQALKIPSARHSSNLVDAGPRLRKLKERQEKLDIEIAELRGRSAMTLEWWVKHGVVGMESRELQGRSQQETDNRLTLRKQD
ncbi:hypothetical protein LTS08_005904 [Lithohypha guttulata]|uniref:uncharacterized protein n=1 Tax=Lithohypha guttulata TaxID=1690604 RepID=UPI002DDE7E11|nr:hypothetical protein LTS08_005904 [Lithohypha guttulata]